MIELEREKTYLLKQLPAGLADCQSEIISDAYIPASTRHPILRLRRRGERYELTKKEPVEGNDSSRQMEHTIRLTSEEAAAFSDVKAKRATKRRYYCTVDGHQAELDLYQDELAGLAILDFEFESDEAMAALAMPDICLADVTQEAVFAGGVLAGKTYADLEPILAKYQYKPLYLKDAKETA
jgi:CYTH domain-containing protein